MRNQESSEPAYDIEQTQYNIHYYEPKIMKFVPKTQSRVCVSSFFGGAILSVAFVGLIPSLACGAGLAFGLGIAFDLIF